MPPSGSLRRRRHEPISTPAHSESTDHQPSSTWPATSSHAISAGQGNMLASAVMYHGSRVSSEGGSFRLSTSISMFPVVVARRRAQVQRSVPLLDRIGLGFDS